MYDGIINVYKEKGFTSHDVVAKLRGILHMKKIGHTGTLDPDAVGVLPVCIGSATKLCDMLTDKTKTYETVMKLGISTDTQDITGVVLNKFDGEYPSKETIVNVINSFVGVYNQIPPMYSALKVNGKKLYELAREGKTIERQPREVIINSINIIDIDMENYTVKMEVDCSKGTYIRTLCNDIGDKLNCGACMEKLIRTRVSDFKIENAHTLDEIELMVQQEKIEAKIVTVEEFFSDLKSIKTQNDKNKLLYNGNKLLTTDVVDCKCKYSNDELVKVYDSEDNFHAIYIYQMNDDTFKVYKMFR